MYCIKQSNDVCILIPFYCIKMQYASLICKTKLCINFSICFSINSANGCINFLTLSISYLTHSIKYVLHECLMLILRFDDKKKKLFHLYFIQVNTYNVLFNSTFLILVDNCMHMKIKYIKRFYDLPSQ